MHRCSTSFPPVNPATPRLCNLQTSHETPHSHRNKKIVDEGSQVGQNNAIFATRIAERIASKEDLDKCMSSADAGAKQERSSGLWTRQPFGTLQSDSIARSCLSKTRSRERCHYPEWPGGGGWGLEAPGIIKPAAGNIGMPFGKVGNWKPKPGTAGGAPIAV